MRIGSTYGFTQRIVYLLALLWPCIALAQSSTEPRDARYLALVIGNTDYRNGMLPGPDNDAADMAAALTEIGFQISNAGRISNLTRTAMSEVIGKFLERVDKNTVAVIFYSGHGIESEKENFLVPIDANLNVDSEWESQLVSLEWILKRLGQREAKTKIVILDACRNMPYSLKYKSLENSGGLAEIKNLRPGTRVIYAASPEHVAIPATEGNRNSVFTAALLRAIAERPLTFDDVITRAAELTMEFTGKRQNPWAAGTLGMSFRVRPAGPNQTNSESKSNPKSPLGTKKNCFTFNEQLFCE